eukprot:6536788-Prymnesium_polylepis.1
MCTSSISITGISFVQVPMYKTLSSSWGTQVALENSRTVLIGHSHPGARANATDERLRTASQQPCPCTPPRYRWAINATMAANNPRPR